MPGTLLFRPYYDPQSRSTPTAPWGLLYVAAPLVQRGIDVDIVDEPVTPDYEERVRKILEKKKPVAVGISTMTGEQIAFGLRFAEFVRKHSRAPIVWGGVHPTLLPEQTLNHGLVDYVVTGEGEYAYAELVEALAAGKDPGDVEGVFMKRNGRVVGLPPSTLLDLGTLPEIPYHLVDIENYIRKRPDLGSERYFEVITSRGCPHPCAFCYIESVHNRRWRMIEPDAAVAKLKDLKNRFDIDCVLFREDNFFVNRRRVELILSQMVKERLGLKWAASCRIDYFHKYTPEFIRLLKESGCVLLTFGVESGHDRVLKFIKKFITVDMVLEVAQKVNDSGLGGTYHFMGGFPSETVEEFLDTCRLIDKMLHLAPSMVARELSVFTPYPGLGLIAECAKCGYREPIRLEDWTDMDWTNPRRPWLTKAQSRLIGDAQWLIARLAHPNRAYRSWIRMRWNQLINSARGAALVERPAIEFIKRRL